MKTLTVALPGREYEIAIQRGLLSQAGERIRAVLPRARRLAVVTDTNVGPLYYNKVKASLERAEDRWKNAQGVYEAAGSPAGKRILLIDDVCSTGSTLVSAAGVLFSAGVAGVVCASAAFPRPEEEKRGEKGKE